MRKLISILMLLILPRSLAFGADTKVTGLSADTAPTATDLIMIVDDVSGTPTSKKVALSDLDALFMETTLATNDVDAANAVWAVSNGLTYEGATADGFETTVSPADPTADQTATIPNFAVNFAYLGSTLTTNTVDAANSIWGISNGIVYEGATADGFETTVSPVDPTADQTASIPNFAVNFSYMGSTLTTNTVDAANSVWFASNAQVWEGATADGFEGTDAPADVTADRTWTKPDQTGTYMLAGAATALTAGAAVTLTVAPGNRLYTDTITTDNEDQTITFSAGGAAGDLTTIIFQTDAGGAGDEVITFHTTLANSIGTLTLANAEAQRYVVRFVSDGTVWNEVSRTAIQS